MKSAKEERYKDRQMWKKIREIIFNIIFLIIAYQVAYTNKGSNSFNYQNSLRNMIKQSKPDCSGFDKVILNFKYEFFNKLIQ